MSRMSGSRILRGALVFAGVLLAGFHGWLFAAQISAGQLDDPWVIFRWLAAAALVISLLALRKSGNSIWGRKGVAIWVLAALLHGPSIAGDADFTAAYHLIGRLADLPLRSLDALHLAAAEQIGASAFATADKTQAEAAAALGFTVHRFY